MTSHIGSDRRTLITTTAVGLTGLVLPTRVNAASGPSGLGGTEPTEQSAIYTSDDTFVVPEGVTSIVVLAEGTAGGVGTDSFEGDTNTVAGAYTYTTISTRRGAGGAGATVSATLAVTPGDTLSITLGSSAAGVSSTMSVDGRPSVTVVSGAGGRGVGLRNAGTWLVVAGGGGGGGLGGYTYNPGDNGEHTVTSNNGGAGGAHGSAGSNGTGSEAKGGGGATPSAVGVGGVGYSVGPSTSNGANGSAPSTTALGSGGSAGGILRSIPGGSGGSGYYGGGSGASARQSDDSGAGGGGGSNYTVGSATGVSTGNSTRTLADGPRLTITYVA